MAFYEVGLETKQNEKQRNFLNEVKVAVEEIEALNKKFEQGYDVSQDVLSSLMIADFALARFKTSFFKDKDEFYSKLWTKYKMSYAV